MNEKVAPISLQIAPLYSPVKGYKVFYQEDDGNLTSLVGRNIIGGDKDLFFSYEAANADKDGWFEARDCENIEFETEMNHRSSGFYVFMTLADAMGYAMENFGDRIKHRLVVQEVQVNGIFAIGEIYIDGFIDGHFARAIRCKKLKLVK